MKYFGSDKNRFQLEIPENKAKIAKSDYEFTSSRKGFSRYHTKQTKEFLSRQMQAEETKSAVLKDLSRRIFAQFSDKYEEWNTAIQCMAMLDVLMSVAEYCRTEEGDMVLPEFEEPRANTKVCELCFLKVFFSKKIFAAWNSLQKKMVDERDGLQGFR